MPPVRFVEKVLLSNEFDARAAVRFASVPTLPMLVEAAAQSSVFVRMSEIKRAVGIPLNVKLKGMLLKMQAKRLKPTAATDFEIAVVYVSNLDNFFVMEFQVYEMESLIAEGRISTLIEKEEEGIGA